MYAYTYTHTHTHTHTHTNTYYGQIKDRYGGSISDVILYRCGRHTHLECPRVRPCMGLAWVCPGVTWCALVCLGVSCLEVLTCAPVHVQSRTHALRACAHICKRCIHVCVSACAHMCKRCIHVCVSGKRCVFTRAHRHEVCECMRSHRQEVCVCMRSRRHQVYPQKMAHTHTQVVNTGPCCNLFPCKDFINIKIIFFFFRRSKRQRNSPSVFYLFHKRFRTINPPCPPSRPPSALSFTHPSAHT
jgi:hypothetical protein